MQNSHPVLVVNPQGCLVFYSHCHEIKIKMGLYAMFFSNNIKQIQLVNDILFSGMRDRVTKALDPRSRGQGFDSRGIGRV